jgi:chromosome segregation ATPase
MKPTFLITAFLALCLPPVPSTAQQPKAPPPALEAAQREVDRAMAEVDACQNRVTQERDLLFKTSGLISASPDSVRQLVERLQTEKEALQVEEAGAKGRQDAIEKAISTTTDKLRARATTDEVTAELQKVIAARQEQMEVIRKLQRANADAQAAEALLATARAELAARKEKIAGPSNELLDALNRELLNLSIARQERAGKLEFINTRLKQLAPAVTGSPQFYAALHNLERAEQHLEAANDRLRVVRTEQAR